MKQSAVEPLQKCQRMQYCHVLVYMVNKIPLKRDASGPEGYSDTSGLYSPEKWLHNRVYRPSNWSKQIQEIHTACSAGSQYTWQSLNKKQYTWLHRETVILCEAMYVVFHQTLPRILWTRAMTRVSFLDLFGPIAGAINPIM